MKQAAGSVNEQQRETNAFSTRWYLGLHVMPSGLFRSGEESGESDLIVRLGLVPLPFQ